MLAEENARKKAALKPCECLLVVVGMIEQKKVDFCIVFTHVLKTKRNEKSKQCFDVENEHGKNDDVGVIWVRILLGARWLSQTSMCACIYQHVCERVCVDLFVDM